MTPDAAPPDDAIENVRAARRRIGDLLPYLGVSLPSLDDLPDPDMLARWHDDLQLSKSFREAARKDPTLEIRLDSLAAVDAATAAIDALQKLREVKDSLRATLWADKLAGRAILRADDIVKLLRAFAEDARPAAQDRARYLAKPVEFPANFNAADPELAALLAKLAGGEKVFGLLARKERALKPVTDAILVNGAAPASPADWAHVQNAVAWKQKLSQLAARWRSLADETGAPTFDGPRALEDLVVTLDAAIFDAPAAVADAHAQVHPFSSGGVSRTDLWQDSSRLTAIEQALRNAVS